MTTPYGSDIIPDSTFITEFWVVSIEHLRRVWHAYRGRLLLRTPGPVLFGTCICSTCWNQRRTISMRHYTSLWQYYRTWHFTESEISPDIGFHRASATGVACRQGALTHPDTLSRPFGTCICSTCWDQSFFELVVILPDYALRISLGTFSILLASINLSTFMKWTRISQIVLYLIIKSVFFNLYQIKFSLNIKKYW